MLFGERRIKEDENVNGCEFGAFSDVFFLFDSAMCVTVTV